MKMRQINPNIWPLVFKLISFISLTVALSFLFSCNPAKKIAKAKQVVLMDPTARHDIFLDELQRFPCVNDSTTTLTDGGYDTVSLRAYFDFLNGGSGSTGLYVDSGYSFGTITPAIMPIDSLVGWDFAEKLTFYYNRGFRDGANSVLSKRIPIPRPDTLKTAVKDRQKEKIMADSISALLREKVGLTATVKEMDRTIALIVDTGKKAANKWIWIAIGLAAALAVSNGLWIYSRIKMPRL